MRQRAKKERAATCASRPTVKNHELESWTLLTVVISVTTVRHKQYNQCTGVPFCPFSTESIVQWLSVEVQWLSVCNSVFQLCCTPMVAMFFPYVGKQYFVIGITSGLDIFQDGTIQWRWKAHYVIHKNIRIHTV